MSEPDTTQNWAEIDGVTAWHLIDRHGENWADIGRMMDEFIAAKVGPFKSDAERLAAEQAVMRQWIAEALIYMEATLSACQNDELAALIESGRRLVDGGPDDLLKGVE